MPENNEKIVWEPTNVLSEKVYDFAEDKYDKVYIGTGSDNYGKVKLESIDDSGDHVSTPFYPFAPKEQDGKLTLDIEAKSICEHSNPEKKIYKYTILFTERVRAVLKSVGNVSEFLRNEKRNGAFLTVFREINELSSMEFEENYDPKDERLQKRKKELAETLQKQKKELIKDIHRILCIAESVEGRNQWEKDVRPLKDKLEKLSFNLGKSEKESSPQQYEKLESARRNLLDKAVSDYNRTNEPFVFE